MSKKKNSLGFEASIAALEEIVALMEQGNLSLDESLKAFEKGVKLTRSCHDLLASAEQKIQLLKAEADEFSLEEWSEDINEGSLVE